MLVKGAPIRIFYQHVTHSFCNVWAADISESVVVSVWHYQLVRQWTNIFWWLSIDMLWTIWHEPVIFPWGWVPELLIEIADTFVFLKQNRTTWFKNSNTWIFTGENERNTISRTPIRYQLSKDVAVSRNTLYASSSMSNAGNETMSDDELVCGAVRTAPVCYLILRILYEYTLHIFNIQITNWQITRKKHANFINDWGVFSIWICRLILMKTPMIKTIILRSYLYHGDYHARKDCLYIETERIYCPPNAKQFRKMFVIVELTYVHNAAAQVHKSLYKVRMKHMCVWLSNKQRSRTSNMAIGWNWNKQ